MLADDHLPVPFPRRVHALDQVEADENPERAEPEALVMDVDEPAGEPAHVADGQGMLVRGPDTRCHSAVHLDERIVPEWVPGHDAATGLEDTVNLLQGPVDVDVVQHVVGVDDVERVVGEIKPVGIALVGLDANPVDVGDAADEIEELGADVAGDDLRAFLGEPNGGLAGPASQLSSTITSVGSSVAAHSSWKCSSLCLTRVSPPVERSMLLMPLLQYRCMSQRSRRCGIKSSPPGRRWPKAG